MNLEHDLGCCNMYEKLICDINYLVYNILYCSMSGIKYNAFSKMFQYMNLTPHKRPLYHKHLLLFYHSYVYSFWVAACSS